MTGPLTESMQEALRVAREKGMLRRYGKNAWAPPRYVGEPLIWCATTQTVKALLRRGLLVPDERDGRIVRPKPKATG